MLDFLDTINKYTLRSGSVTHIGGKISKKCAAQLVGSLVLQGRLNHYCAALAAQFMVSSEVLVVASRDAVQGISCEGCTLERQNLSSVPDTGEIFGVATTGNNVVVGYSAGVAMFSGKLELEKIYTLSEYTNSILGIAVTPDGSCLATGGANAIVTVWSRDMSPVHYLAGHTDWVRFVKFTIMDGRGLELFSTGDDGLVLHWDPLVGTLLSRIDFFHGQDIHAFEVSWRTGLIGIARDTPTICLYKPQISGRASNHAVGAVRLEQIGRIDDAHHSVLTALRFSNDSQWIVSAGEDETLSVSSVCQLKRVFVCETFIVRRHCMTFMNTFTSVCVLASPPESSAIIVVACATDGTVVQWVVNPETFKCTYTKKLQLHLGALVSMDVVRSHSDCQ